MGIEEALAIAAAGFAAGTINTVVGSGTLITFPVLLAFGYPPVTANVSNNVGLVPGSVSGAIGYRRELDGQRVHAMRLGVASVLGGITGAALLLSLPSSAFEAIVPVFIAIALVLVVVQPSIARALARRTAQPGRRHRALTLGAVHHRCIWRLFRGRPGHPPARHFGLGATARSAQNQRVEERARRFGERCGGGVLHRGRTHRVGARGDHRGRVDPRRAGGGSLRPTVASQRPASVDRGGGRHRDRAVVGGLRTHSQVRARRAARETAVSILSLRANRGKLSNCRRRGLRSR